MVINGFNELLVALTGSSALMIAPEMAMPVTPVRIRLGTSSIVMPPMAKIGIWMPACSHCAMIRLYPSRPRIGLSRFLVSVKRNGPRPM